MGRQRTEDIKQEQADGGRKNRKRWSLRKCQKYRFGFFLFVCLNLYSIYLICVFCYLPTELPFVPMLLVTAQIRFIQLGHAKRH